MTDIFQLLSDAPACAVHLGLRYGVDTGDGHFHRRRQGRGFSYDKNGKHVTDQKLLDYFHALAIPPAWREVTIARHKNAHILATGIDEEGRKQYIYHPDWLLGREILGFYKLIHFGARLPVLRDWIHAHLQDRDDTRILAGMLLTLDKTSIRVGNQNYYDEHETVGLTTLCREHVQVSKEGVTFHFTGKSGQEIHTVAADPELQHFYRHLLRGAEGFLFPHVDPTKLNHLIQDLTQRSFTAKDFRTWGGTLYAYEKLVTEKATPLEAIDYAAEHLGNTRSVARTYYVHPHMLEAYEEPAYHRYFLAGHARGDLSGTETALLRLLKRLKKDKFDIQH